MINMKTGQSVSLQPKDHKSERDFFDLREQTIAETNGAGGYCDNLIKCNNRSTVGEPPDDDGSSISGSSSDSGSESIEGGAGYLGEL